MESLFRLVAVAFLLVLVGSAVALAYGIVVWVLGPLGRAAKDHRCLPQFTMADFLCLFFLLQLPMGLLLTDSLAAWEIVVFAWAVFGPMWWVGLQTLSRAGVVNPWHRAVFLSVVIPVALVGSTTAPLLMVTIVIMAFEGAPFFGPAWLLAIEVVLGVLLYVCGRLTRRFVRTARPPSPQ